MDIGQTVIDYALPAFVFFTIVLMLSAAVLVVAGTVWCIIALFG